MRYREGCRHCLASVMFELSTQPREREMAVIKITNNSDREVSWFCYNSYDTAKGIALLGGSGDLAVGASVSYDAPRNSTGNYYVRFTHPKGSLSEFAGCHTLGRSAT